MRRPGRIVVVLLTLVAFFAVSAGLARVLSANGAEREAILELLQAQAKGDAAAMIGRIDGCTEDPSCRTTAERNARRLRSDGDVDLVRLDPSTSFSIGGGTRGTARVVWNTPSRTTVVQCVVVERGGDVLSGLRIELRSLSRPIDRETSCPGQSAFSGGA